jgi:hypothetical protein
VRVVEVIDVPVEGSVWELFTHNGQNDHGRAAVTNITFASFEGRKGDFVIAKVSFRVADSKSVSQRSTRWAAVVGVFA